MTELTELIEGQLIVYGGDRVTQVSAEHSLQVIDW